MTPLLSRMGNDPTPLLVETKTDWSGMITVAREIREKKRPVNLTPCVAKS
jgi:hypothetical protein